MKQEEFQKLAEVSRGRMNSKLADRELRMLEKWIARAPGHIDRVRDIFVSAMKPMVQAAEDYTDEEFATTEHALAAVESLVTIERAYDICRKLVRPGLRYGTAARKTDRLSANCIGYYLLLAAGRPKRDPHQQLFAELGVRDDDLAVRVLERYRHFIAKLIDGKLLASTPPKPKLA